MLGAGQGTSPARCKRDQVEGCHYSTAAAEGTARSCLLNTCLLWDAYSFARGAPFAYLLVFLPRYLLRSVSPPHALSLRPSLQPQITELELDNANLRDENISLSDTPSRLVGESRRDKRKLHDVEVQRGVAETEWRLHRTSLVSTTARNIVRSVV